MVASFPTCSLSRHSASSTPLGGTRSPPCVSARWSECLAILPIRLQTHSYWCKAISPRDDWNHVLRFVNISILSSASCPQTTSKRIKEGTGEEITGMAIKLGPVLEVQIVKILGQPGLEISIPSTLKHLKNEIRSSTELLSAFQNSEGREPSVEEEESHSIKETCAHPVTSRYGNNEACVNNVSNLPSDSLFNKTIIPTNERKWIVIDANPSHGGALSIQASTAITKMVRHHDQDEREQDGSFHWDTVRSVLLKAFGKRPLTSPTLSISTSSSQWFPSHWPTNSTPQTGLFLWPFCRTVSAHRFSTEAIFHRQSHFDVHASGT